MRSLKSLYGHFSVKSSSEAKFFIDAKSGQISVHGLIDRERVGNLFYLTVQVTNFCLCCLCCLCCFCLLFCCSRQSWLLPAIILFICFIFLAFSGQNLHVSMNAEEYQCWYGTLKLIDKESNFIVITTTSFRHCRLLMHLQQQPLLSLSMTPMTMALFSAILPTLDGF